MIASNANTLLQHPPKIKPSMTLTARHDGIVSRKKLMMVPRRFSALLEVEVCFVGFVFPFVLPMEMVLLVVEAALSLPLAGCASLSVLRCRGGPAELFGNAPLPVVLVARLFALELLVFASRLIFAMLTAKWEESSSASM